MRPVFTGDPTNPQDLLDFETLLRAWEIANPGPGGPVGAAGADGANGTNGIDGADGIDGTSGADGVDGTPGVDGVDGIDGLDGPVGPISELHMRGDTSGHNYAISGPAGLFGPALPGSASADFTRLDQFQLRANFTGRMILELEGTFAASPSSTPQRIWLLPRKNNVFQAYATTTLYFAAGTVVTPYIKGTMRLAVNVAANDIIDIYSFRFGSNTAAVQLSGFLSGVRAVRIS